MVDAHSVWASEWVGPPGRSWLWEQLLWGPGFLSYFFPSVCIPHGHHRELWLLNSFFIPVPLVPPPPMLSRKSDCFLRNFPSLSPAPLPRPRLFSHGKRKGLSIKGLAYWGRTSWHLKTSDCYLKTGFPSWWVSSQKTPPNQRAGEGRIYYLQQVRRAPEIFPKATSPTTARLGKL